MYRNTMLLRRLPIRAAQCLNQNSRALSMTNRRFEVERQHPNVEEHRKAQTEKPLNPHMTNTTSTISNDMPAIGKDKPPPEMISSVDPEYTPDDVNPENTERMTGGTQKGQSNTKNSADLGPGEMEGAKFKVEPLRRKGEDDSTMRARLLYQSRKRGTLESDLLLSTFADARLASMSRAQLEKYDLFLDENDWDIYYWATQEPTPTSQESAEGSGVEFATEAAQGRDQKDSWSGQPPSGEWAQTVGRFKPAYRPVPSRWKDSDILALLRQHVVDRSAGAIQNSNAPTDQDRPRHLLSGQNLTGRGLGRMPEIKQFSA